jgi:superfamily II DNA/RNA helicase
MSSASDTPRDEWGTRYIEQLPYPPYPVQEEALLAWFTAEQGVLVCAPTGTGKTLIAEAALYEALHTGRTAYYTTPLIALTEQKYREMTEAAVRWGFSPDDVGLVTGNRKVNPTARVLVVVAEILLNRLLRPEGFDFSQVASVVMDEFHSFADPERGIVWELSLSMLPKHVRLLLLSATVGNAREFVNWLDRCHGRKVELVEGTERRVPLTYQWVPNQFLGELLVEISKGNDETRKTPALVFCFNRDECWSTAEMLKGLDVRNLDATRELNASIDQLEWPNGVGPKLKQMLRRGIGVHHAGLLPFYRRTVEDLFQRKLLSVAVCTETLAAGINLPARSVVMTSLMKGPFGKEKLIDPSSAHQIFGRAGRPQFDKQGFVYALAHEDDVRILRWKEKYDQIPEDTKDPALLKKKKEMKRKKPERNSQRQYWSESHFERLKAAAPARLYSKGPLPWRLLAYLLEVSPDVQRIRQVIHKRLLDESRIVAGEKVLEQMLLTLHEAGFATLDPAPQKDDQGKYPADFRAERALPRPAMAKILAFRGIHPLYGAFLLDHLGKANWDERLLAFESVLEIPRPLLKFLRVPRDMPPGPLESERIRPELEQRGLLQVKLPPSEDDDDDDEDGWEEEPEPRFPEKLAMYFAALRPDVADLNVESVWGAGEILKGFGGNFNLFIRQRDLTRQEGIVFRHLLRLILLIEEFAVLTPAETTTEEWQEFLGDLRARLTETCRGVDPTSTNEMIQRAHAADVVEGETKLPATPPPPPEPEFGAGLFPS